VETPGFSVLIENNLFFFDSAYFHFKAMPVGLYKQFNQKL